MLEKTAFTILPFTILFSSVTLLPNRILLVLMMLILMITNWPAGGLKNYQKIFLVAIPVILALSLFVNPVLSREFLLLITVPVYLFIFGLSSLSPAEMKRTFINGVSLFAATLISVKLLEILYAGSDFIFRAQWWNELLYKNLSERFGAHPTYLSLFFLSGLVLLIYGKDLKHSYSSVQRTAITSILLLTTLLLSVKIALLFLAILAIFQLFKLARDGNRAIILKYLSIVTLFAALALWNPGIRHRLVNDLSKFQSPVAQDAPNRIEERLALWQASLVELEKHPFIGSSFRGITSREAIFRETRHLYPHLEFAKNSHNNFLESGVRHGIFGLAICISAALVILGFSWKKRSLELLCLCLLFFLFSLTESFLFREQGITLFALLLSIFGINYARDFSI